MVKLISYHQIIIGCLRELSYFSSDNGVCTGIAYTHSGYYLRGEKRELDQTISFIQDLFKKYAILIPQEDAKEYTTKHNVFLTKSYDFSLLRARLEYTVKDRCPEFYKERLSWGDQEAEKVRELKLLSYFESIALYQSPAIAKHIKRFSADSSGLTALASDHELTPRPCHQHVGHSHLSFFTQSEYTKYLSKLSSHLSKIGTMRSTVLFITPGNHTTSVFIDLSTRHLIPTVTNLLSDNTKYIAERVLSHRTAVETLFMDSVGKIDGGLWIETQVLVPEGATLLSHPFTPKEHPSALSDINSMFRMRHNLSCRIQTNWLYLSIRYIPNFISKLKVIDPRLQSIRPHLLSNFGSCTSPLHFASYRLPDEELAMLMTHYDPNCFLSETSTGDTLAAVLSFHKKWTAFRHLVNQRTLNLFDEPYGLLSGYFNPEAYPDDIRRKVLEHPNFDPNRVVESKSLAIHWITRGGTECLLEFIKYYGGHLKASGNQSLQHLIEILKRANHPVVVDALVSQGIALDRFYKRQHILSHLLESQSLLSVRAILSIYPSMILSRMHETKTSSHTYVGIYHKNQNFFTELPSILPREVTQESRQIIKPIIRFLLSNNPQLLNQWHQTDFAYTRDSNTRRLILDIYLAHIKSKARLLPNPSMYTGLNESETMKNYIFIQLLCDPSLIDLTKKILHLSDNLVHSKPAHFTFSSLLALEEHFHSSRTQNDPSLSSCIESIYSLIRRGVFRTQSNSIGHCLAVHSNPEQLQRLVTYSPALFSFRRASRVALDILTHPSRKLDDFLLSHQVFFTQLGEPETHRTMCYQLAANKLNQKSTLSDKAIQFLAKHEGDFSLVGACYLAGNHERARDYLHQLLPLITSPMAFESFCLVGLAVGDPKLLQTLIEHPLRSSLSSELAAAMEEHHDLLNGAPESSQAPWRPSWKIMGGEWIRNTSFQTVSLAARCIDTSRDTVDPSTGLYPSSTWLLSETCPLRIEQVLSHLPKDRIRHAGSDPDASLLHLALEKVHIPLVEALLHNFRSNEHHGCQKRIMSLCIKSQSVVCFDKIVACGTIDLTYTLGSEKPVIVQLIRGNHWVLADRYLQEDDVAITDDEHLAAELVSTLRVHNQHALAKKLENHKNFPTGKTRLFRVQFGTFRPTNWIAPRSLPTTTRVGEAKRLDRV